MNWKRALFKAGVGLAILSSTTPIGAESYQVKPNDTLYMIAKQHRISLDSLFKANPKVNALRLQIGQKIEIPSTPKQAQRLAPLPSRSSVKTPNQIAGHAFSKVLAMKASAYSSSVAENGKWGAVDYFGNPLKVGTVAVDPDVIPLGSTLYIKGYSFPSLPQAGMLAKATDIGGKIQGNRIDIFVPASRQEALKFGKQDIEVYVIDTP